MVGRLVADGAGAVPRPRLPSVRLHRDAGADFHPATGRIAPS